MLSKFHYFPLQIYSIKMIYLIHVKNSFGLHLGLVTSADLFYSEMVSNGRYVNMYVVVYRIIHNKMLREIIIHGSCFQVPLIYTWSDITYIYISDNEVF
jgi:hypothetical protein